MGKLHPTAIQWATHAVNPIIAIDKATGKQGWACTRIAPGCQHCYAETINVGRFGNGHRFDVRGNAAVEWRFDESAIQSVLSRRKPATIFWADMTDLFHENVPDAWLDRCFAAMALTPHLRHIVLTKRAKRMREYVGGLYGRPLTADDALPPHLRIATIVREWPRELVAAIRHEAARDDDPDEYIDAGDFAARWPLPNVALGVSVACQADADELVPELLATPAALRFVSYEPGIEVVDWQLLFSQLGPRYPQCEIDAVIIGGESGPHARPFDLAWARDTIRQCEAAGVVVQLKQLGHNVVSEFIQGACGISATASADKSGWRYKLRDSHGGDPAEWPADLRPYACSPEKWPWRTSND